MCPELRILILRDNKPGHFNQSEGIAQSLELIAPSTVLRLDLKNRPNVPNSIAALLPKCSILPESTCNWFAGLNRKDWLDACDFQPDFIISSGGRTLLANLSLTHKMGSLNIHSGSTRSFDTSQFTSILNIDRKFLSSPRHIVTLKPSTVTYHTCRSAVHSKSHLALLLGGPTRYQPFERQEIKTLVESLARTRFRWTILDSRRTPTTWRDIIAQHAARSDHLNYRQSVQSGTAVVDETLCQVDGAVVSEDSCSMISEGVAAGLPVIGLCAANAKEGPDTPYLDRFLDQRRYQSLTASLLKQESIVAALSNCKTLDTNHKLVLARQLRKHIPQLLKYGIRNIDNDRSKTQKPAAQSSTAGFL